jgi:hypothetical protein
MVALEALVGLVSVVTERFLKPPQRLARREPALVAAEGEELEPLPMAATVARQFNM